MALILNPFISTSGPTPDICLYPDLIYFWYSQPSSTIGQIAFAVCLSFTSLNVTGHPSVSFWNLLIMYFQKTAEKWKQIHPAIVSRVLSRSIIRVSNQTQGKWFLSDHDISPPFFFGPAKRNIFFKNRNYHITGCQKVVPHWYVRKTQVMKLRANSE